MKYEGEIELIRKTSKKQMSEAFLTVAFLSLSGGLQDAYTYIYRGHVFANAQTGNIVLLAQGILERDPQRILSYLMPLTFFAAGIAAAEWVRRRESRFHWRQWVLLAEMLILLGVGFMPQSINPLANGLVSFACAMQVQAFRKVNGYGFASTMCIGNLRSGMESLCAYPVTHNPETLRKAAHYFGVIFLFATGAALGGFLLPKIAVKTIWVSCALLFVSFMLMFIEPEEK